MKKYPFIIFLFLTLLAACNSTSVSEDKKPVTDSIESRSFVKLAPVLKESPSASIRSLGVVISKTEAKPSFKTGGIIDRAEFKEGDFVRQGQLMATLILNEINAQLEQAREGVIKAERDLQRAENLHADSVATLEQVQNATSALVVARQNLEIAQFNRQFSEVRAPISGKIVKKLLHAGEIAGPGMPVGVILGVGKQDWRLKSGLVPEDWSQVDKGHPAQVELEAYPGQTFKAVVSDKAVITTDRSGTLEVELTLTELPPSLAAGMIGRISIPLEISVMYTTIPIDALVNTNGRQANVFTIDNQRAVAVPILIDRILGDRVMVEKGLENIDSVVTIGAVYLESGDHVSMATH